MKPSGDTIKQWVAEAEADPRLSPILAEVGDKFDLAIGRSHEPTWYSGVKGVKAAIYIADTTRPMAAFAHELLHLQLSARGYRHITFSGNPDVQKNELIQALLQALDNELQHHKMFPAFLGAGFESGDFYADSDDSDYLVVEHQIGKMTAKTSAVIAAFDYLALIAPGGGWPAGKREQLTAKLEQAISADAWGRLQVMKGAIETWSASSSLDPIDTIVAIFEALGDLDKTFIGSDQSDYPDAGAFIPRSLTPAQFEELVSKA